MVVKASYFGLLAHSLLIFMRNDCFNISPLQAITSYPNCQYSHPLDALETLIPAQRVSQLSQY